MPNYIMILIARDHAEMRLAAQGVLHATEVWCEVLLGGDLAPK